jgi:hypothetical protein
MAETKDANRRRLYNFASEMLLQSPQDVLDNDLMNNVMSEGEKSILLRSHKSITPSLDSVCAKLQTDADYAALYTLLEAVFNIGALTTISSAQIKMVGKVTGAKGAKISKKTREEKANKQWRQEALELAVRYLEKYPNAPMTDIANYIDGHFKGENPRSYDTYKKQVSVWFKDGTLKRP